MQLAFLHIIGSLQIPSQETMLEFDSYQEAAYDLFVREHEMSTYLDGFPELYLPSTLMHNYTLTRRTLRTILASQLAPFATLSFAQRFSTAVNAIGWPVDVFLDLLLRPEPAKTVAEADKDGKTALHWAAANFGEWSCAYGYSPGVVPRYYEPRNRADSYASLASELVRMGSDIHALWYAPVSEYGEIHPRDSDPFINFLRGRRHKDLASWGVWPSWSRESLSNAVNRWGQMLVAGGHSLVNYVATENRFLSRRHWIDACHCSWTFSPTKLAVLKDGTLSVQVIDIVKLPVWKAEPIHVPGAWPVVSTSSSTIIWDPEAEDESDGFQWSRGASLEIVSDLHQVWPLDRRDRTSDLADWALKTRWKLIHSATQDDHGTLAIAITREIRSCHVHSRKQSRRRSASLPPFPAKSKYDHLRRQDHEPLESTVYPSRSGTYAVHKCALDGRWSDSSHYTVSLRDCMRSHQRAWWSADHESRPKWGWEQDLLTNANLVRVARRFAERFHPRFVYMVDEASQRAVERAQLTMGPRRREDDGMYP
jgi:hypothetical protein